MWVEIRYISKIGEGKISETRSLGTHRAPASSRFLKNMNIFLMNYKDFLWIEWNFELNKGPC